MSVCMDLSFFNRLYLARFSRTISRDVGTIPSRAFSNINKVRGQYTPHYKFSMIL